MMSVLEIYINWVNSVLGEVGGHADGVGCVQDGKVLCDLIDVLAPDAGLVTKVKASGECTPLVYINAALSHMKSHGIKIKFPPEDIIHNEIKSLLDILWILILNYGIHFIGQNAFQRSVGIGKKQILEWCQDELGTTFDHRNTLTYNLCNGNWFVKLLEQVAGCSMQKSKDTSEYIDALLTEIQDRYCIMKEIIKSNDIVDGTVDEHTLMIYLSLLRRRASSTERHRRREMLSTDGKAAAMAKVHFFEKRARSLSNDSQRSRSADSSSELSSSRQNRSRSHSSGGLPGRLNADLNWPPSTRTRSKSLFDQVGGGDGNETSDWSSTGSLFSGREPKVSPKEDHVGVRGATSGETLDEKDEMLQRAISESVSEVTGRRKSSLDELVASAEERLGKEAESQRLSEKETDTLSDFSSSSLSKDKPCLNVVTQDKRVEQYRETSPLVASTSSQFNMEPIRPPRAKDSSGFDGSIGRSGAPATAELVLSSSDSENVISRHQWRQADNGSTRTSTAINVGGAHNKNVRASSLPQSEKYGGRTITSTPIPRPESTYSNLKEENVKIKITRPKDYIHQWEDTIDRLSGASVTDRLGSPRAPLISSYSNYKPNGRSRSYEISSSAQSYTSSSYSKRDSDVQRRSRSITEASLASLNAPPLFSTPSRYINGHHSALTLPTKHDNQTAAQSSTASNYTPKGSNLGSHTDAAIATILNRLPSEQRHKAQEASRFLMQTSGLDVLALMDAIQQDRGSDPIQDQPQRNPNGSTGDEQTILKRREHAMPSSQSSGARVHFEPEKVSPPLGNQSTPLPPALPRLQSSSPRRRGTSPARTEGKERGSHRMLSLSPKTQTRSRSLSPRAVREAEQASVVKDVTVTNGLTGEEVRASHSSRSLTLREGVLLRNLDSNTRVLEEERPSSRLMAMTSSPRVDQDRREWLDPISPRRPVDRVSPTAMYPEVTRLELGLDSDRSYISHDGDADSSTPPVRRATTGGRGAGRMPRREAWEMQRQRRAGEHTSHTVSGSAVDVDDTSSPEGQSRFIEILCKEIDALKAKVDTMDEENVRRISATRASRSPSNHTAERGPTRLGDEHNKMVYYRRRYLSNGNNQSVSPGRGGGRATSCPLLETSSRSPALSRSLVSPRHADLRRTPHPSTHRPVRVTRPLTVDTTTPLLRSSPGEDGIILGYSSPARSVTPEIWGHEPLPKDQNPQDTWKRLITTRHLNEQQVIELKQALACALVENDILTAKLNNARHEIHDKLHHTNNVLDDCRRHLAKSQAENQELRTALEQERSKSASFESRIREMEDSINEVKVNRQHLECELNEKTSRLNRSLSENKPGVDALRLDNSRLVTRLAAKENENDSLREEVQTLKHAQNKAMLTMDELRECLSKVRRERQELFDECNFLRQREQRTRVREIMGVYQEKGAIDEREREPGPSLNRPSRTRHSYFESDDSDIVDDDVEDNTCFISRSKTTSPLPSHASTHLHNARRLFDDLSPTRSDREIYPHRKSYTPRSRSASPHQRNRHFPTSTRYSTGAFSNTPQASDLSGNSIIDQTLQEIERDMQRERQTIMSAAESALRRPRLSSSSVHSDCGSYFRDNQFSSPIRSSCNNFNYSRPTSPSAPTMTKKSPSSSSRSRNRSPSPQCGGYNQSQVSSKRSVSKQHSPVREPIYPRSHHSRDPSTDDRYRSGSVGLNNSFCCLDDLRQPARARSGSPRGVHGSVSARPARDVSRASVGGNHSTPGSPARSPRYFPRTAHSPPTRLPPEEKTQTATFGGNVNTGRNFNSQNKTRPLVAKSGKGEIARNLQREFDQEDKLLSSLANSSVVQNKSWFEMQSESDGDDTGINSSMSSRSSCERPVTGRKKTPFLSDDQRRYADELIRKYTGNALL